MKKTKKWFDIIVLIGTVLIVIGLIVPLTFISGTGDQGMSYLIKKTALGWSFKCTGFSFVLLGSVFKLFINNMETELNEIKYKIRKLDTEPQNKK